MKKSPKSYGYNGRKSEPKIGKLEKKWLQCNRKSEAEKRDRKSENGNVVTMSDFSIFRFSDPFFGKSGFSENVVTMSDFWLRFSENRKFFRSNFSIGFFYRIPIFWDVLKGGPDRSFSDKKTFSKNDLTTPNFMRGIDCAHSRIVKMLPWPWFREVGGCIEAKIEKVRFSAGKPAV